jgi:GT2 family glycosyltransferase
LDFYGERSHSIIMNRSVWIIIPVHNRRETTRACLVNLGKLGLPADFLICVVHDGYTDGTTEMLAKEFPHVHSVMGNGNLYWGGGIAFGMEPAGRRQAVGCSP